MKSELQEKLCNKYPTLFAQKGLSPSETNMCWGICVCDGWYNLLDEICTKIMAIDEKKEIQFTQIKEKFGGLRIYFEIAGYDCLHEQPKKDKLWDDIHDILKDAEDTSFTICEDCGKPGTLRTDRYWIRTLCNDCSRKDKKDE